MKIFKKKTVETSNDVYEAYKAELNGEYVEKKNLFSLGNIIKLEVLVVALGLFFMNQNDLSLKLTEVHVAKNKVLPVSIQLASLDKDLVVTQEETAPFEKIKIREDNQDELVAENLVDKETYLENTDMKLLIALLQSEVEEKLKSDVTSNNRVIISQK